MMLTLAQLVGAGIAPTQARLMLAPLQSACMRFDIDTPPRVGAFVAQCNVESGFFTRLEENCYWTTPERILKFFTSRVTSLQQASLLARNPKALANTVYAGRMGNGDVQSGDGWRYRGRGPIQLTGLDNYREAGAELGRPYVEQPDLVALPLDGVLTAAWFWHVNKLNLLADSGQIDAITRTVNKGMSERDLRRQLTEEAVLAFTTH